MRAKRIPAVGFVNGYVKGYRTVSSRDTSLPLAPSQENPGFRSGQSPGPTDTRPDSAGPAGLPARPHPEQSLTAAAQDTHDDGDRPQGTRVERSKTKSS